MVTYQEAIAAVVENSNAGIVARNAFVPLAVARLIEAESNNGDYDIDNVLAELCNAAGITVKAGKAYRATMLHKGSGCYTAFTNLKTIWDNRKYALNHVLAYGRYVPAQMVEHMGEEMGIVCQSEIAAAKQAQHELSEALEELNDYCGDNAIVLAKLKAQVSKAKGNATRAENTCAAKVKEFSDAYIAALHDVPSIPASVNAMVSIVTKAKNAAKAPKPADTGSDSDETANAGSVVLIPETPASEATSQLATWIAANGDNSAVILSLASDIIASLSDAGDYADTLATMGDAIAALFASRANADTDKATGTNG